jgi:hypothetical protein
MRLNHQKSTVVELPVKNIIAEVIKDNLPEGISCLINGDYKG